jgi:catechol 2,3-dioxygenase-like lactoylglutathione lyase family enzyme
MRHVVETWWSLMRKPVIDVSCPRVEGVLETCLYAADLVAAERFYSDVIGLSVYARLDGRHIFFGCGDAMFLVFNPSATAQGMHVGKSEPRLQHGATGPGHVAFRVQPSSLATWRDRLEAKGVSVEAEVTWPGGGRSIYTRDPAGNSVELATADIWTADPR